jgi:hypothetical protein
MEKEIVRNNQPSHSDTDSKQASLAKVVDKWRVKVFEGLVANKRYELVIRDNLTKYSEEKLSLKQELSQAQILIQLTDNKLTTL